MVIFVIKKGDYITRKSYGNDTVFLVLNVRGDTVYLKGVYARLYADSPIDDCVSVDKSVIEDDFRPANFIDEVKKLKGIGIAYVTTAIPLSLAKQKEIEEKLLATTSFKQMEMHFMVDEELIGGMVIRIGDRVVDSSIKTKLFEMRRTLLKTKIEQ